MKSRPANLFDVARLAGVSIATVSRVANGGSASPATRAKVREAIEKLGYVVHGTARALVSRRTHTIGALIPDLDNAIFASTTNALQKVLDSAGYMLTVACHGYDLDVELRLARNLIERGVDGLVMVGTEHRSELLKMLSAIEIPYVFSWADDETGQLPTIGCNHRRAMAEITQYLIDLGHRDFAVVSGVTRNNDRVRQRLAGVVETLEASRIHLAPERIVEVPFSYTDGEHAMRQFLRRGGPPTAVVCLNDVQAIGAMSACRSLHYKVPEDVSITGCVDLDVASQVQPALTTVHFPTVEMGHFAGAHLLAQLAGETAPMQQRFPTQLVIRGSTRPPKGASVPSTSRRTRASTRGTQRVT